MPQPSALRARFAGRQTLGRPIFAPFGIAGIVTAGLVQGIVRLQSAADAEMTQTLISDIAETLKNERNLEGLVRRFLEIIEIATGLDSAYLTRIDADVGLQTVIFARNTSSLVIPEGLSVPWGDTLCKRALDEGCPFTDEADGRWADSGAARELGIRTYMSTPVFIDKSLFGTLCGASSQRRPAAAQCQQLLVLFGEIIALYLEREAAMEKLRAANGVLEGISKHDELTGLINRRSLIAEISPVWDMAAADFQLMLVAFIDLDNFKAINDAYGHDVGDEFLTDFSRRLRSVCRAHDLAARVGGDEFVVIARGPVSEDGCHVAAESLRARLEAALCGTFDLPSRPIAYPGPSIGIISVRPETVAPGDAIRLADEAMYRVKRSRRSAGTAP